MRILESKRLYWIYAALAVALTLSAGLVVLSVQFVAERQNSAAIQTQQKITGTLTRSLLDALAGTVTAEAFWDEAYNSTVASWDQSWVEWEYGSYLQSLDVQKSLVFGPDGTARFAFGGKSGDANALSHDPQVQALVADVRRVAPGADPKVSRGFLVLDGKVHYGGASYIVSDKAAPNPARPTVLVFIRELAPSRYLSIGEISAASEFEVKPSGDAVSGKVSAALNDVTGREVARLWWTPYQPGTQLTSTIVPVALIIFVALGVVLLLLFRAGRNILSHAYASEALAVAAHEESRAKTAFLASLSHDLRTPLNAIIGFSDIMSKEIRGPLGDARYKEYIGHIYSSGTHLLRIINDLLDLAKLDAQQTKLECSEADVRAELEEACSMLQLEADRAGIKLVRPLTLAPTYGWCDARALLRVFINLLGNALKFTESGGTVTITLESTGEHVIVKVADTGIGIKAEDVQKLGRPFVQVGSHMTSKKGTGLGLSICKGLLEMMGGSLTIESEYGLGTTVTVCVLRQSPDSVIVAPRAEAA